MTVLDDNRMRIAGAPAERGLATTLHELLPFLESRRGKTVVIKYGGAAMVADVLADVWARDVVLLQHLGIRPLVVHGGGRAVSAWLERLGLSSRFHEGHRVTDLETAEVAQMVLSGQVNKAVVARLNRAGARAIGLSGTDASLLQVRRLRPGGTDIGYVGEVRSVDVGPFEDLLDDGFVPVLSPTAASDDGQPHNINADLVAGAVAAALEAVELVFLTDVAGLRRHGHVVPELGPDEAREALARGEASGGMRPKLQAALAAIEGGVGRVCLCDGRRPHALLEAMFGGPETATRLLPEVPPAADGDGRACAALR